MLARRLVLFAACLLPAVMVLVVLALAYQNNAAEETRSASGTSSQIGERLVYTIKWDPPWYLFFLPAMEAGEADLRLVGETEYNSKKVLKILLKGRSSGTLAKMTGMKVEDEFVFFTEPNTFCTLGSSKKIREGKRKRQVDVEYLRETRQVRIREMDESVVPPRLKKDEIKNNIPSCVQDPLSALYFFRMSPLRKEYVQTFVIGYDDRIKEVRARVENQETVATPAGNFVAWKVTTIALMGGLFKEGGQFRVWLSADEKKTPVQFEVNVSLGKVVGKLKPARQDQ